jgi:hypothetical protein
VGDNGPSFSFQARCCLRKRGRLQHESNESMAFENGSMIVLLRIVHNEANPESANDLHRNGVLAIDQVPNLATLQIPNIS